MKNDRDFDLWLKFFEKEKPSLTKFFSLLKKKDTYFLNHPLEIDFDHELYEKVMPGGFIEKDFQEVLINNNPKDYYCKTRIAIALFCGLSFDLVKARIKEDNFFSVLEKVLIDGHYEEYDIPFEKLISIAISKNNLPRTSLVDIAFLRGVNLGSRYISKEDDNLLKQIIFKNKIKLIFNI